MRRLLSATPCSRSITDLWHQMMILDGGERLGSSFYKFRAAVCEPEQRGASRDAIEWVDKEGAAEAVYGLLDGIIIRNKLEACVDIPPNHLYTVSYDMSPKQQKMYIEMEKTQLALLNEAKVISAVNAGVVAQKLLQIASGSVYDEFGDGHIIDDSRYALVADLVEARKHSVVFTNWKHQVRELINMFTARKFKFAVIDGSVPVKRRVEIVKMYQAGFYDVLICDIAAAAHGVTLTRGTTTIFCSPTYNTEHFDQALHRIYRKGQTQKTETIVIIAKNTIDGKCYGLCEAKGTRQRSLLRLFE
jgi:SNF2 family DNA or RNA helicase